MTDEYKRPNIPKRVLLGRTRAFIRWVGRKHDEAMERSMSRHCIYYGAAGIVIFPAFMVYAAGFIVWSASKPFRWAYTIASPLLAAGMTAFGWKLPFTVATLSAMLFLSIHTVLIIAGVVAA